MKKPPTYPVEKAVPIPKIARRPPKATRARYPWRDMAIGDSFAIPLDGELPAVVEQRVWRAAYAQCIAIIVRYLPEADAVRVWYQGRRRLTSSR